VGLGERERGGLQCKPFSLLLKAITNEQILFYYIPLLDTHSYEGIET